MRLTRAATTVHKWLALLMAVQILFWVASGLFFAAFPIERVRSEDRIAEVLEQPVPLAMAAEGLARLADAGVSADRVELRMLLGKPVAALGTNDDWQLYDLATAKRISPVGAAMAREIALIDTNPGPAVARVSAVKEGSTEYRGELPAWRVDFADGYSVYVAADTAKVTARRSDLWRTYDFLWALHIMDYRAHEDFNTPLLVAASLLGLVVVASGIVMLPSRFGLRKRKRTPAGGPASAR